jgi:hypothetical protein
MWIFIRIGWANVFFELMTQGGVRQEHCLDGFVIEVDVL